MKWLTIQNNIAWKCVLLAAVVQGWGGGWGSWSYYRKINMSQRLLVVTVSGSGYNSTVEDAALYAAAAVVEAYYPGALDFYQAGQTAPLPNRKLSEEEEESEGMSEEEEDEGELVAASVEHHLRGNSGEELEVQSQPKTKTRARNLNFGQCMKNCKRDNPGQLCKYLCAGEGGRRNLRELTYNVRMDWGACQHDMNVALEPFRQQNPGIAIYADLSTT